MVKELHTERNKSLEQENAELRKQLEFQTQRADAVEDVIQEVVPAKLPPDIDERIATLTLRLYTTWVLLTLGEKNRKEIADILGLAQATIDSHAKRLMDHLGVHSDVSLTMLAIRKGIIKIKLEEKGAVGGTNASHREKSAEASPLPSGALKVKLGHAAR